MAGVGRCAAVAMPGDSCVPGRGHDQRDEYGERHLLGADAKRRFIFMVELLQLVMWSDHSAARRRVITPRNSHWSTRG